MSIQELQRRPTVELLALIYGTHAPGVLDTCGGSLDKVLQNTMNAYAKGNTVLHAARELLARAFSETLSEENCLNQPQKVREYLAHRLFGLEREVFLVLALDARMGLLHCEELFRGTLTQTSVYPREIVKHLLGLNAAGAIFAHNHPSGNTEPSGADQQLTSTLKQALALVDIRVYDHIIAAGGKTLSFAERGLL